MRIPAFRAKPNVHKAERRIKPNVSVRWRKRSRSPHATMVDMSITVEEIHSLIERYLAEYPDEYTRLARLSGALTTPGEPGGHVTSAVVLIDPRWRVLHL